MLEPVWRAWQGIAGTGTIYQVAHSWLKMARLGAKDLYAGGVSKITYSMKRQFSAFQIDGFEEAAMEEIASQLKNRAKEFSIDFIDRGIPRF